MLAFSFLHQSLGGICWAGCYSYLLHSSYCSDLLNTDWKGLIVLFELRLGLAGLVVRCCCHSFTLNPLHLGLSLRHGWECRTSQLHWNLSVENSYIFCAQSKVNLLINRAQSRALVTACSCNPALHVALSMPYTWVLAVVHAVAHHLLDTYSSSFALLHKLWRKRLFF